MQKKLREKGAAVVAEWRPGHWYAGKIYKVSEAKLSVRFVDGDTKTFGRHSSKVIAISSSIRFDRDACGPYSREYAEILAQPGFLRWSKKARWVIVERSIRRRGKWEFEWLAGRIIEMGKPVRSRCCVRFNSGGDKICLRPEGISFICVKSPFTFSGPYDTAEVAKMTGPIPQSPLPKAGPPRIIRTPREPQPVRPDIGQRVIGKASSAFSGWFTGAITNIRREQGIIEILFDNGKKLGAPAAVSEFRPISTSYAGATGPLSDDSAASIWKKFGLRD